VLPVSKDRRVLLSVDSIELACRTCAACLLILYVCCFLRVLLPLESMCVAFYACCFLGVLIPFESMCVALTWFCRIDVCYFLLIL